MVTTWSELNWSILDRLRDGFLHGGAAAGPYWQTSTDLAHYDFTFAERIGWKWDHVLAELQRRGWTPPAGPLLDWGCGSGIASRRVLAAWPSAFSDVWPWDHSPLASAYVVDRTRQTYPHLPASPWDGTTAPTTLVISHVLNELDANASAALEATVRQAQAIIWIEPGTSAVAKSLVEWRQRLLPDFRVVYPCTHQGACGMLSAGNERHWCHHFARPPSGIFADSDWVRFGQRAGIDLRSLPYSALVLERTTEPASAKLPANAGRVIGRPEVFKPYARFLGCDADGLHELTLPKRLDPRLWKRFDRTDSPRCLVWQHHERIVSAIDPALPPSPASENPSDD